MKNCLNCTNYLDYNMGFSKKIMPTHGKKVVINILKKNCSFFVVSNLDQLLCTSNLSPLAQPP